MAMSSVCLQTAAILARTVFPFVAAGSCVSVLPSLPVLLAFRLVLEQKAREQAVRWSTTADRRSLCLLGSYVLVVVLVLVTPFYRHYRCAQHLLLGYALALACGAGAVRPAWEENVAALLSAAALAWPAGTLDHFDVAFSRASVLVMLGASAATVAIASCVFTDSSTTAVTRAETWRWHQRFFRYAVHGKGAPWESSVVCERSYQAHFR
ncbi:uncharacterized protein LOC125944692 [Dermacentor silvarum]|uniref:uncharacterized protein LOC125944692 n=1 Tax=Dermacentor silvarum TaxID=543639 RepID=UPI002100C2BD|nr:uncharacterized protein LOC125944692 [Dermacentor silvarum]